MTSPNGCRLIPCAAELTGTSHRQGQTRRGRLQLQRHRPRTQPWMVGFQRGSERRHDACQCLFGSCRAETRFCAEAAPRLSFLRPSRDATPERLRWRRRMWLPPSSIREHGGEGRGKPFSPVRFSFCQQLTGSCRQPPH